MKTDQKVTIMRAGMTIYSDIFAQIDHHFAAETADMGGAVPKFTYTIFLTPPPGMAFELFQSDLIVVQSDTLNTVVDNKTAAARQYRIIDDPPHYPDGHHEALCERYRGT